jgi:hypothetical protein
MEAVILSGAIAYLYHAYSENQKKGSEDEKKSPKKGGKYPHESNSESKMDRKTENAIGKQNTKNLYPGGNVVAVQNRNSIIKSERLPLGGHTDSTLEKTHYQQPKGRSKPKLTKCSSAASSAYALVNNEHFSADRDILNYNVTSDTQVATRMGAGNTGMSIGLEGFKEGVKSFGVIQPQHARGQPSTAEFERSRMNNSKNMAHSLPFEQVKVTPGLGLRPDEKSKIGFQDPYRVAVDGTSYRKNTFHGRTNAGGYSVSKQAQPQIIQKHRPETTFSQDKYPMVPTASASKAPMIQSDYKASLKCARVTGPYTGDPSGAVPVMTSREEYHNANMRVDSQRAKNPVSIKGNEVHESTGGYDIQRVTERSTTEVNSKPILVPGDAVGAGTAQSGYHAPQTIRQSTQTAYSGIPASGAQEATMARENIVVNGLRSATNVENWMAPSGGMNITQNPDKRQGDQTSNMKVDPTNKYISAQGNQSISSNYVNSEKVLLNPNRFSANISERINPDLQNAFRNNPLNNGPASVYQK